MTRYGFVVAGQSNAVGYNADMPPDVAGLEAPVPGCFMICAGIPAVDYKTADDGVAMQMQNPVQHPQVFSGTTSFSFHFARILKEKLHPSDEIYLIGCAFGGTSFTEQNGNARSHWRGPTPEFPNGGSMYEIMVARTRMAVARYNLVLSGLLWHQGENDATNANYRNDLAYMLIKFREAMSIPLLPVVYGTPSDLYRSQPVYAALMGFTPVFDVMYGGKGRSVCARAQMTDLGKFVLPDQIHFTRDAHRSIGTRYFEAFLTVTSLPIANATRALASGAVSAMFFPGATEQLLGNYFSSSPPAYQAPEDDSKDSKIVVENMMREVSQMINRAVGGMFLFTFVYVTFVLFLIYFITR